MMKVSWSKSSLAVAAIFGGAALLLSNVSSVPLYETKTRMVEEIDAGPGGVAGPSGVTGPGGAGSRVVSGGGTVETGACAAGRNGGSTDSGVTGTQIKLGATVVRSGIGSSFLGGAPVAMQAVVNATNRAGGVCGRLLDVKMVDDGWAASRGVGFLRSLIAQGVFAIPVAPSSEGVNQLILAGDLRKKGIPLVGADGMVKSMYKDPWVWPVATSTVSTMHIIAQEAYKRGARTFGLAFAKDYAFGVEGALAFNNAVKRLTGRNVPGFNSNLSTCEKTFCGITSGQPSYNSQVQTFNSACQQDNPHANIGQNGASGTLPSCDFIAYLTEPKTALTWLQNGGYAPGNRTMGPQPLFNSDFAKSCAAKCNNMIVWTSYNPPLDPYRTTKDVVDYVQTVRRQDPSLDTTNSFTEGAYLGMKMFVEAARIVGADLKREKLRSVLNSATFNFGLGPKLSFGTGTHLGHGQMQSYKMRYSGQTFVGFQHDSAYVRDRYLGQDF